MTTDPMKEYWTEMFVDSMYDAGLEHMTEALTEEQLSYVASNFAGAAENTWQLGLEPPVEHYVAPEPKESYADVLYERNRLRRELEIYQSDIKKAFGGIYNVADLDTGKIKIYDK